MGTSNYQSLNYRVFTVTSSTYVQSIYLKMVTIQIGPEHEKLLIKTKMLKSKDFSCFKSNLLYLSIYPADSC